MAHALSWLYGLAAVDFQGAVNAQGDSYRVENPYVPLSPMQSAQDSVALGVDGAERRVVTRRNVTEQVVVVVQSINKAGLESAKGLLEKYLLAAEYRQETGLGYRLYVSFQPDGYTAAYRSEILSGRVEYLPGSMSSARGWFRERVLVTWTRRFFWEGVTEIELAMRGQGDLQYYTGGVTLYNHCDAAHGNYVDIDGIYVGGSALTPIRLTMENLSASPTREYRNVVVALNRINTPSQVAHVIEGEAAASGGSTVTPGSNPEHYSNGQYRTVSWTATTETKLLDWSLGPSLLDILGGRRVRIMARTYNNTYTDLWLRLKLLDVAGRTVWAGSKFRCLGELQDWGIVQLPPNLSEQTGCAELMLTLYGTRNASGTHTLNVDYFQLLSLDGWRAYSGGYFDVGYALLDDGLSDALYTWLVSSNSVKKTPYRAVGAPLLLRPGQSSRLYFLWDDQDGYALADHRLIVRAYYRPRRLTL